MVLFKVIKFGNYKYIGDPLNAVGYELVDEIIILDIAQLNKKISRF